MIAYLKITSYFSVGEHYYGELKVPGAKRERVDISYTLTESDCRNLNRRRTINDYIYKLGDTSTRFRSKERLIGTAIQYVQEKHPEISLLLQETYGECDIALWHRDGAEAVQELERIRLCQNKLQEEQASSAELNAAFNAWKAELKRLEGDYAQV
jgi:hypothetical protein